MARPKKYGKYREGIEKEIYEIKQQREEVLKERNKKREERLQLECNTSFDNSEIDMDENQDVPGSAMSRKSMILDPLSSTHVIGEHEKDHNSPKSISGLSSEPLLKELKELELELRNLGYGSAYKESRGKIHTTGTEANPTRGSAECTTIADSIPARKSLELDGIEGSHKQKETDTEYTQRILSKSISSIERRLGIQGSESIYKNGSMESPVRDNVIDRSPISRDLQERQYRGYNEPLDRYDTRRSRTMKDCTDLDEEDMLGRELDREYYEAYKGNLTDEGERMERKSTKRNSVTDSILDREYTDQLRLDKEERNRMTTYEQDMNRGVGSRAESQALIDETNHSKRRKETMTRQNKSRITSNIRESHSEQDILIDEEEVKKLKRIEYLRIQEQRMEHDRQKHNEAERELKERIERMKKQNILLEEERKRKERFKEILAEETRLEASILFKVKEEENFRERLRQLAKEEERLRYSFSSQRGELKHIDSTGDSEIGRVIGEGERRNTQMLERDQYMRNTISDRDREQNIREEHLVKRGYELRRGEDASMAVKVKQELEDTKQTVAEQTEHELKLKEEQLVQKEIDLCKKEKLILESPRCDSVNRDKEQTISDRERELNIREENLVKREHELRRREDASISIKVKQEFEDTKHTVAEKQEHELKLKEERLLQKEIELCKKEKLILESPRSDSVNQAKEHLSGAQDITTERKEQSIEDNAKDNTSFKDKPFMTKFSIFSGEEPKPKNEVTFEEWKYEVSCVREGKMYPEYMIAQGIRRSLKGQAKRVLLPLGPTAGMETMVAKLEGVFGNVATGESVLQEFYTERQKQGENVTAWALRLEEIIQRAIEKGHVKEEAKNDMLRTKFWKFLINDRLKNATRIHVEKNTDFDSLRREVRKEEHEMNLNANAGIHLKTVSFDIKDESKFDALMKKLSSLENQMEQLKKENALRRNWARDGRDRRSPSPTSWKEKNANKNANKKSVDTTQDRKENLTTTKATTERAKGPLNM